ncbi:uncharacterized protein LOC122510900 [Leptopilina heterotoma]|uniref:uncharacterized protein LOC122510900 n=1 Tax=Leptopilina heterotoma TaxID=63436 RepID=UPI001CA8A2A5|nr:uncharacterized protein LOC122510900 [Leptopilina heterotoma]XP_043481787.1 uncharacterized protein LOC122510900 [Leptopilina heterotoma]
METNERLLNGDERETIQLKCNFHYVCSAPGLIQIVELMLPPLGFLFITIQILDSSLIELSNRWIIIQLFLILLRLIPFLLFEAQATYYLRALLLYELCMTVGILACYVVAIPFIFSKDEPRAINMMVFITCGIIINAAHIAWILFRIVNKNSHNW